MKATVNTQKELGLKVGTLLKSKVSLVEYKITKLQIDQFQLTNYYWCEVKVVKVGNNNMKINDIAYIHIGSVKTGWNKIISK